MDMVLSIISSLGIDSTLFIQLAIYLVTFVALYMLVFKPYFDASEERRKQTSGSLEFAEKAEEMIKKTEEKYQTRARQINDEIALLFKEQRSLAVKEADKLLEESSTKSKDIMSQAQQKLSDQMEQAQTQIEAMSKDISAVIVQQLLTKRGKN
jgi:F-type H+-transporting ATPase subunit b